jgi:beta-mannosidase
MQKIFFFLMTIQTILNAQTTSFSLNENWRFKPAAPRAAEGLADEWHTVKIPALVHNALMEQKVLPDLFYRDNESKYQYLEREDWVFEKMFDLPDSIQSQSHIELTFNGLDTYADVFLNGELILKANNAFRSWQIDIKKHLREKNNILRVYFYSAVKMDEDNKELHGFALPGIPTNERVFSRKGQFNYGWDWGPRFVSCGIWRDVEIKAWSDYKLREMNVLQMSLSESQAILQTDILIESDIEKEINLTLELENQVIKKDFFLKKGLNQLSFQGIEIKKPKRWWSRDIGEPNLYEVKLTSEKEILQTKIGLRTIELVQEKDKKGSTFYFRLNGVPVFAKGANYIPLSIFQDNVTDEDYKEMLQNAADANMNMLRVWGGGIYENEQFYDLCDELGIMVWQDFMFACAMYPGDKSFLQNIENEAVENIKRLRHHPSIALWCGNNEISEAWHNWGWQEMFLLSPKRKDYIWSSYKKIFQHILPDAVKSYGNGINYWESSPSYSRYHEKCDVMGDSHYWGVWHDEEPFEQYAKRVPRFMSEYGFQSFPEWKTIETFTESDDRGLETPIMTVHQKHPRGNTLMRKYMAREYHVPQSFEDFTYVSQLVQAEGMRRGIEAHRRAMPYCMGTLYWQLNDVWPVASWSSIDGLGRWKALHYVAREAFAPVLISPTISNGNLSISLISDRLQPIENASFLIEVFDFQGNRVFSESDIFEKIDANSSVILRNAPLQKLLNGHSAKETYAAFTLSQNGKIIAKRIFYFDYPKNLKLPTPQVTHRIEAIEGGFKIILHTDKLAKNVFLQTSALGRWSDNYFDLLPNETKEIMFKVKKGDFNNGFQVKLLTETY